MPLLLHRVGRNYLQFNSHYTSWELFTEVMNIYISCSVSMPLCFPVVYLWVNVKIVVEKQLMFAANSSFSVLREKQLQNNIPRGSDLNPRKDREALLCSLVQVMLILPMSWTTYTLVKLGWTCRPRKHTQKKHHRSPYFIWTKIFEIGCWIFIAQTERGKLGTTATKKNNNNN